MEEQNVAIRLKGFIDTQRLTHSQFADVCQIPRPSLSQILSGRNKKISDVIIGQIHKAFPSLSILWLLFGEGAMLTGADRAQAAGDTTPATPSSADVAGSDLDSVSGLASGNGFSDFLGDDEALLALFENESASQGASADMASASLDEVGQNEDHNLSDAIKNGNVAEIFAANRTDANFQANLRALKSRIAMLKGLENEVVEYKKKISDLQLQIENLRSNPRKVSHITVYYDDSTFETFFPK